MNTLPYAIIVMAFVFSIPLIFDELDARSLSPFHFRLAEPIVYDDLWFYVEDTNANFMVRPGETATFPIIINSATTEPILVDFHATIGDRQTSPIRMPLGTTILLEPNTMLLEPEVDQILNVTVSVSENAPFSKYDVQLVGVWKEPGRIAEHMGTSFSLHVGDDFGDDAIPVTSLMPPLQFHKEGFAPEEITCRLNLTLILKNDNSPACVRQETKAKLIEREWMKTQVDVFDDAAFIASTKDLNSVQLFLSMHPNAKISVDEEWFTVTYEESGFREHSSSNIIYHTKRLIINLDYDGKPRAYAIECGGPVSAITHNVELLENPDWCFPINQTEFSSVEPTL